MIDLSNHDHDYLTRREAQERRAAKESADLGARRAHAELAERYARRLQESRQPA